MTYISKIQPSSQNDNQNYYKMTVTDQEIKEPQQIWLTENIGVKKMKPKMTNENAIKCTSVTNKNRASSKKNQAKKFKTK